MCEYTQFSLAEQEKIHSALELARMCHYEPEHAHQVTFLAQRLFAELQALHQLGERQRFWLLCASLLHDIGLMQGLRGHHKTSLRIILETPILTFSHKERLLVGSIARYHRGALPRFKHDHYAALNPQERKIVNALAALLRLADGLDYAHNKAVQDVHCEVSGKKILLICAAEAPTPEEEMAARQKSDLLERVYGRKLVLRWEVAP